MSYLERLDNDYVVDMKMCGFDQYHSAYLVARRFKYVQSLC